MAKVAVKSDVFNFYLKSYNLDAEELSKKSGIAKSKLEAWSKSDSEIPIGQLRSMADVYKKHWGIFLLDEPTEHFKKPKDYRARSSHDKIGLLTRLAFEEANRLIEISKEYSLPTPQGSITELAVGSSGASALAVKVRSILKVSKELQSSWNKPEDAWKYYFNKIQSLGFIVSEQKLDNGVDGFIVVKDDGVAIVINQAVKNTYRKTFTLIHELGHYLQRVSAACDTSELTHEVAAERYANSFASFVLVPEATFSSNDIVIEIAGGKVPSNSDYATLSKQFCISMSQVAMRLHDMKLIDDNVLDNQLNIADKIFRKNEEARKKKSGFDPKGHERRAINRVGVPLASSLLTNYNAEKITARDFSGFMGVKINLVGRIADMLNERH